MIEADWIEIAGFHFPRAPGFLTDRMRHDLKEAAENAGIFRRLVSFAKAGDHALVLGPGAGLMPVVLAGRVGMRHLTVVEPDPRRRGYLRRVFEANGLFRIAMQADARPDSETSLLVADLPETAGEVPETLLTPGLRGAMIRLADDWRCSASTLPRLNAAGLHYFPRQSSGDVLSFLRKWN